MLIDQTQITSSEKVGTKAWGLVQLRNQKINVPRFWIADTNLTQHIREEGAEKLLHDIQTWCNKNLPEGLYAVRSSSPIEDLEKSSWAGQFITETKVPRESIGENIRKVVYHAQTVSDKEIAVIVQEWIIGDISGVIFSREPSWRHYYPIIEYIEGGSEDLVSGRVTPKRILCTKDTIKKISPALLQALRSAEIVEKSYEYPVDIEWLISKNTMYFVQARPITTLTKKHYAAGKIIEEETKSQFHYLFDRSELANTVMWGTFFNVDLIQHIYRDGGPVFSAYKSVGISYRNIKSHRAFGPYLYINKQAELKSLLPVYEYKGGKNPSVVSVFGFWRTLKNTFAIAKISTMSYPVDLKKSLDEHLKVSWNTETMEELYVLVDNVYKDVALAGLYSMIAEKKLTQQQKLINGSNGLPREFVCELPKTSAHWIGNSLDPFDTSVFQGSPTAISEDQEKNQDEINMINLRGIIMLREYSRWVSVKLANTIRAVVSLETKKLKLPDGLYYFASKEEREKLHTVVPILTERLVKFDTERNMPFPTVITDITAYLDEGAHDEASVLSPGNMKGRLVNGDEVGKGDEPQILLVEVLSPDLVRFFGKVSGIITRNGGVLSHLSILAREKGIPVVQTKRSLPKDKIIAWYENTKEFTVQ